MAIPLSDRIKHQELSILLALVEKMVRYVPLPLLYNNMRSVFSVHRFYMIEAKRRPIHS